MINAFVVDNFHPKPYELREFALKQDDTASDLPWN